MKFYSRRQLAGRIAIIAAVALLAGGAVSAFLVAPRLAERAAADAVARVTATSALGSPYPSPSAAPANVPSVQNVQLSPNASGLTADELNNIDVYNRVNKSVVYITSTTTEYSFFGAMPQTGTGSGMLIDTLGHVLTNNHVVEGADALQVTLADGATLDAKVTGTDPQNDLAVIEFDPKGHILVPVTFGNSATLQVGQKVLAIGNPFGLDRTLTTGIISALERSVQTDAGTVVKSAIQTDAAINPGNSGGPLMNSHGEVIGINSSIVSTSGSSAGVGFAIPVNTARRVADELIKFGVVRRGWIDIDPVPLFSQLVRYFKLPVQDGILVSQAGSNAKAAGIKGGNTDQGVRYNRSVIYAGGDIIIEVNGQKTDSLSSYLGALEQTKPGEVVPVKIMRGTREMTVSVKLIEQPKQ